tara:strand:- start:1702 stop:2739 length:1038 start_codon:yes stop_codon:yes gene_type:complete
LLKNYKKILIIGLGSIGQRHFRNLKKIGKNFDFYALRKIRTSPELSKYNLVKKKKFSLKKSGIKDISERNSIKMTFDAVFICNPSSLHMKFALKFAKKNTALFIEKPISHNLKDTIKLKKKINKNKIICAVGYQLRYHNYLHKIKKIIENKLLGDIKSVEICNQHYLPYHHKYEDYRKGYAANKKLGGGVILCFIHEIDYSNFLFGLPTSVKCISGKKSNLEMDVEDFANLNFKNNLHGNKFDINIKLDFVRKVEKRECKIIFQHGKIIWDLKKDFLKIKKKGRSMKKMTSAISRNQLFKKQLIEFNKCIDLNLKPLSNYDNGFESLFVAVKAKESNRLNKRVFF